MKTEKIKKMSIIEIIEKVGIPTLLMYKTYHNEEDLKTEGMLRQTYVYNASEKEVSEFEEEIKNMQNKGTIQDFIKILDKYQHIIDKEIYVFAMTGFIARDIAEGNKEGLNSLVAFPNKKRDKRASFYFARDLLKNVDIVVPRFSLKDEQYQIEAIVNSQEYFGNNNFLKKRKEENDKRFKQIDETIGLDNVFDPFTPSDMLKFFVYPNLANLLANNVYKKLKINKDLTESQRKEIEELIEKNGGGNAFAHEDLNETIINNTAYIDVDKMLLLSNIKNIRCLFYNRNQDNRNRDNSYDYDNYVKIKEFSRKVGTLLKNKQTIVEMEEGLVNYKTIEKFISFLEKHFINKRFYDDEAIDNLRNDVLNGIVPISMFSKEDFLKIMNFTSEELATLITKQPDALEYLVENDLVNISRMSSVIDLKKYFTDRQVLYLLSKGIIKNENVLEMYNKGKFSVDNIRFLQDNFADFDATSMTSVEKLVKLYLDPSKKEEFDKYRKIFKALKIDETLAEARLRRENKDNKKVLDELDSKIKERQIEVSSNILDQSLELLEEDKLYDLYRMGLIHIEVLVDFVGPTAINDLYATGELKPLDARKLYNDGIIDENAIESVLKDGNLSETQKLVLIYSTFPSMDQEDKEIRERLISYMDKIDDTKTSTNNGTRNHIGGSNPVVTNKYYTDPCARWNFIASFDKDYTQNYLTDGTIIFYLPNEQKYIIEKLYDKNNKPAYGAATYILEENLFDKIKNDLIVNEKIDRSVLIELHKQKNKGIKKFIHTGWANSMMKFFDLQNEEKYSKEEIERKQKLAKQVEISKTKEEDILK